MILREITAPIAPVRFKCVSNPTIALIAPEGGERNSASQDELMQEHLWRGTYPLRLVVLLMSYILGDNKIRNYISIIV